MDLQIDECVAEQTVDISKLVEAKVNASDSCTMEHRAMKLRLIELQLSQDSNRQLEHICEQISKKYNVHISIDECRQLIKKYHVFTKTRYLLVFLSSLAVALLSIWYFQLDTFSSVIMLLLVPLIFNSFSDTMVSFYSLNHDVKALALPKMSMNDEHLSVAVVLPSRNEPFAVAKMTFDSAMALNYQNDKKKIVVVDNSDCHFEEYIQWQEYVESFAQGGSRYVEGVEVLFIHRDGTEGFKPRNLDLALEKIDTEMILYLDIDSTLEVDTLLKVVPQFRMQPKLGFIQLYTLPTNTLVGSALAMTQGIKSYLERLQLVFSSHGSYTLFYGHNAIWRTEVVKQLGDCLEYYKGDVVVAEDLSMTLRARMKGYYGKGEWVQTGEWVPCSMRETEAMWLRWTVGTMQVFAKHLKSLLKSKEVKIVEAIGWYQHAVLFANGGLLLVFVAMGLLFNFEPFLVLVLCSFVPQVVSLIGVCVCLSLGKMSFFGKLKQAYLTMFVLNGFINWVRCIGLARYVTGKKQGWTPTGKAHEGKVPVKDVFLKHLGMLGYGGFGIIFCIWASATSYITHPLLLAGGLFFCFNLWVSVFVFGLARMEDTAEHAASCGTVQDYVDFY